MNILRKNTKPNIIPENRTSILEMFEESKGHKNLEYHPAFVIDDLSGGDVARAIIDGGQQNEPFYIFDMDVAYHYIQLFKRKLPRVQIFYAIKANDSEAMVRLAVAMGFGFDCASPGEINRVLSYNLDPTSIIYAVPTKTPDQMIYAKQAGVKHTTFNTSCELKKTKQYWPDAKLLIRIKVESDSIYKLAEKFGCDFESEAFGLLEEAASLGLTVIGVAFHVGSACSSLDSYVLALGQAKALFDHEAKAGRQLKILDIGGGFFCENDASFEKASNLINDKLAELFPDPSVQIVAEPGRFICEAAFTLYSNINDVRMATWNNKPINKVYINDGVNGTLRFVERWHKIRKFSKSPEVDGPLEDTILFGPTPDSRDYMEVVQLPRCSTDDWLQITMQGAYSVAFSGNYAGFSVPKIRPIISSSLWKKIKDNPVFSANDFVLDADISQPLPATLPPCLSDTDEYFDYRLLD